MVALTRTCMFFAFALPLTACGGERVAVVKPPVELTTCADEPQAPALPSVDWSSVEVARPMQTVRDQMTLAYVLAMRSAWGSCKATVEGVKAWSDGLDQ